MIFFNWPILTPGDIGSSYTSTIAVALLDPLFLVKELLTFGIGFLLTLLILAVCTVLETHLIN